MRFARILRRLISYISIITMLLGILGFIANMIVHNGIKNPKIEFPIPNSAGIEVNDSGIYIGLIEYSRIQRYDFKGNFIEAWNTNTYAKDFHFYTDENGTPTAFKFDKASNLNDEQIDNVAKLINDTSIIKILKKEIKKNTSYNPNHFHSEDYGDYYFKNGLSKQLFQKINGKEKIIICQPFYINCFAGPFNAWITAFIGLISLLVINIKNVINLSYDPKSVKSYKSILILFKKIID